MQLFGPHPQPSLLIVASRDRSPGIRVKAATLMGINPDKTTQVRLRELLSDKDLAVQRAAAEALTRAGGTATVAQLEPLLASPDRHVAWAAARLLQKTPAASWQREIIEHENPRAFLVGSMALLWQTPPREDIDQVLARCESLLDGYLTDDDFIGLLRVAQLGLIKGEIAPDDAESLRQKLSAEYPAQDERMNRELVRLLVYLQDPTMAERMVSQLATEMPSVEKMQILTHARFLTAGWTPVAQAQDA